MGACDGPCPSWTTIASSPSSDTFNNGSTHHFTFAIPSGTYAAALFTVNDTMSGLSPGTTIFFQGSNTGVFGGGSVMFGRGSNTTTTQHFGPTPPILNPALFYINQAAGGNLDIYVRATAAGGFTDVWNCFELHLLPTLVDGDKQVASGDCETIPSAVIAYTYPGFLPFPTNWQWVVTQVVDGFEIVAFHSADPQGWTVELIAPTCGDMEVCAPCWENIPGAPPPSPGDLLHEYRVWWNIGYQPFLGKWQYWRSALWDHVVDDLCNPTGTGGGNSIIKAQAWNLEDTWTHYHATGIDAPTEGNVIYYRSDHTVPLPAWNASVNGVQVTGGGLDSDPKMIRDTRGHIQLVFARRDGTDYTTYLTKSYDDGATWTTPASVIPDGKHPTIAVGKDGTVIVAAVVDGTLKAKVQGPGQTDFDGLFAMKDESEVDLTTGDTTFHICQAPDRQGRFLLHTDGGYYQSADVEVYPAESTTWKRISTGTGGTHQTVAVNNSDGTIVLAAYSGGKITAMVQGPGQTSFGAAFNFKDDAGADLALKDEPFHLQAAYDKEGRWLLHAIISAATYSSHRQNGDIEKGTEASWKTV